MRSGLAPISKHIDQLNRAYASLDNRLDSCETRRDYAALLDDLEASEAPYADILYQYAWEIIQARVKL